MNFRRYYIPGSAVFITQVIESRQPIFQDNKLIELLRVTLRKVKEIHPFLMLGYVFLYDHFHMIIQPTGESNFSDIMHSLKPNFTKEYKKLVGLNSSQTLKFWQKRFWRWIYSRDSDIRER